MKNVERLTNLPQGFGIEWISGRHFRLEGYSFSLAVSFDQVARSVPVADDYQDNVFFLLKSTDIIQRYLAFFREKMPKNIVQLGVFRGGSVGFLSLLAKPERLLALELDTEKQEFLDSFIRHESLEESVRVEYGVDQADYATVDRLAREFIGDGRSIDVVFDDASHMLSSTRGSFEALFPLLRPGGAYIVEDFATAQILVSSSFQRAVNGGESERQVFNHLLGHSLQADRRPLHLLAVEAMLASISAPGIVERVVVDRQWLKIIRGRKEIDSSRRFDLKVLADDRFGLLDSRPDDVLQNYLDSQKSSG